MTEYRAQICQLLYSLQRITLQIFTQRWKTPFFYSACVALVLLKASSARTKIRLTERAVQGWIALFPSDLFPQNGSAHLTLPFILPNPFPSLAQNTAGLPNTAALYYRNALPSGLSSRTAPPGRSPQAATRGVPLPSGGAGSADLPRRGTPPGAADPQAAQSIGGARESARIDNRQLGGYFLRGLTKYGQGRARRGGAGRPGCACFKCLAAYKARRRGCGPRAAVRAAGRWPLRTEGRRAPAARSCGGGAPRERSSGTGGCGARPLEPGGTTTAGRGATISAFLFVFVFFFYFFLKRLPTFFGGGGWFSFWASSPPPPPFCLWLPSSKPTSSWLASTHPWTLSSQPSSREVPSLHHPTAGSRCRRPRTSRRSAGPARPEELVGVRWQLLGPGRTAASLHDPELR